MADYTETKQTRGKKAAKEPALTELLEKLEIERLSSPVTQEHINERTPMGVNLIADGATFRVWAPNDAIEVYIRVSASPDTINGPDDHWQPNGERRLHRNGDNTWTGFLRGVRDGDFYRFYIANRGAQPYKRDPYARELEFYGYPDCDCIVRDPISYPWHDQQHRTPPFNDLVIYEFHIGRFYGVDNNGNDARQMRVGNFLDVLDQIPHLVALGVNAIEPMPIVEFQGPHSLGYNGTDIFSPEMDYGVESKDLAPYLEKVNRLLADRGCAPLTREQLESQVNQLKAMIDICHLYGISVILDVVYNHAGRFSDDDESIFFFDHAITPNNNESLYFTDGEWAGGLVFAYWKNEVRQFLIDNATFFLDEYHVDGLRYDEVTVIDNYGGWRFLQDLTSTVKYVKPQSIHIAEYWRDDPSAVLRETNQDGAGFDAVWHPGIRHAVRDAIAQAAQGRDAYVNLNAVRDQLYKPGSFSASWRAVQHLENHDLQRLGNTNDREPRVPALADATNPRSWYARSRSRVAMGMLLTAPGIPMLFMGQEILEDKYWSDAPDPSALIWWDGLKQDKHMQDYLRFSGDLVWLRRRHPALRGEAINVFHVHEGNRVIAYHRWLETIGRNVVVVASLNESAFPAYDLGFPVYGDWLEVFNSDAYDNWINPNVAGNGGRIQVNGSAMHGLPYSCSITIPANSMLVFALDAGDNS
ncbi:MAG: alpha amylase C-terminal domain-containing protein [Gammaproteobacteria bacterium]|nr:alpha amylase C-terminal domain-containing protein [Gammaproteobacteria bacterium]